MTQDNFQSILQDLSNIWKTPGKGGEIMRTELERHFAKTPIEMVKADYLVNKAASDIHRKNNQLPINSKAKIKTFKDSRGMAYFLEHGFRDGIMAKRAGNIAIMLDFAQPSELTSDIQELRTMLEDLTINAPLILGDKKTGRINPGTLPFTADLIDRIEADILPRLAQQMAAHNIESIRKTPDRGCEYFHRIDPKIWKDLTSTATSRPRGPAGRAPKPPSRK